MKQHQHQARWFKVLMHPARLAILEILRGGEQCVCHMEAHLDLRQAYISQHLMTLRDAGLVTDRRDGLNIFYTVSQPGIYAVLDAMNAFSGIEFRPQTSNEKTVSCPCPKCNPNREAIGCSVPLDGSSGAV